MAVEVFKNKESKLIPPEELKSYMIRGWGLSPFEDEITEPKENAESDKDIRAKAKKAGIPSWHLKSIEKLKEELKDK